MLTSALTEEELASRLAAREAEVATLRARLEKLQSTVTRPVAPHAREELTKKINKYKVTHLGYSVPPCCVPACLPARDVKSHLRYVCMCASLSLSHTHTHSLSLSLTLSTIPAGAEGVDRSPSNRYGSVGQHGWGRTQHQGRCC